MGTLRIKQVKSINRQPKNQKATMKALGLGGISRTVELDDTPQVRGMIRTVQHLISVEEGK